MTSTQNNAVTSNGISSSPSPRSTISAATPSSYMYTSSSSLLRSEKALPRAVPPPTLPKYTAGSSSFRLASLDRLAHRQRQFDQQHQPGSAITSPPQANGDVTAITSPSQQQTSVSLLLS
ncbi:hypothetical protein C0J52_11861 [Blattella germanica]|nr:hypothetical protein C0J52_11861 [Blattella germanica]